MSDKANVTHSYARKKKVSFCPRTGLLKKKYFEGQREKEKKKRIGSAKKTYGLGRPTELSGDSLPTTQLPMSRDRAKNVLLSSSREKKLDHVSSTDDSIFIPRPLRNFVQSRFMTLTILTNTINNIEDCPQSPSRRRLLTKRGRDELRQTDNVRTALSLRSRAKRGAIRRLRVIFATRLCVRSCAERKHANEFMSLGLHKQGRSVGRGCRTLTRKRPINVFVIRIPRPFFTAHSFVPLAGSREKRPEKKSAGTKKFFSLHFFAFERRRMKMTAEVEKKNLYIPRTLADTTQSERHFVMYFITCPKKRARHSKNSRTCSGLMFCLLFFQMRVSFFTSLAHLSPDETQKTRQ